MKKFIIIGIGEETGSKLEQLVEDIIYSNSQPSSSPAEIRDTPYRVKEAAQLLGVSESNIYSRCKAGSIRTVPNVGRVLIPASEIQRLIN